MPSSKQPLIVRGYGSAGAGNRTGRRIASTCGVGQTARERSRRVLFRELESRVDEPTKDQLVESISDGRCWWCGQDRNRLGEALNLGLHWSRRHGISIQRVRDILQVPKKTTFPTPETHAKLSEISKRRYVQDALAGRILRQNGGKGSRILSVFGVEANRNKLTKIDPSRRYELNGISLDQRKYAGLCAAEVLRGVPKSAECKAKISATKKAFFDKHLPMNIGDKNPAWKGESASPRAKRARMERLRKRLARIGRSDRPSSG